MKKMLAVENGVFLIGDALHFGYQGHDKSNPIAKSEGTETLMTAISELPMNTPVPASKRMRETISSVLGNQDPHYAQFTSGQMRVMRLHGQGATKRAAEEKSDKPKPPSSDVSGYLSVASETGEILDHFVKHRLVFAKDSYKEWTRGQVVKGEFTNLGGKPFITGNEEDTINFFFDDNVRKHILSVIRAEMHLLNAQSTPQDKIRAIQQQEAWVGALQKSGHIKQVSTYEAATVDDYFIHQVNQLLQQERQPLLLTAQTLNHPSFKKPKQSDSYESQTTMQNASF